MEDQSSEADIAAVPHSRHSVHWQAFFWAAILLGFILRIYCVAFTNGTGDMDDWEDHAQQVHDHGLIGYYHTNSYANHPPFIFELGAVMVKASVTTGIPFRILFRSLFALLDGGNALLLFSLLPKNRYRFAATVCYWLSPAAIILSAYHGNTDTAVAFFLLLSIWLATKTRTLTSGIAFGAGLWVKLPGILALPALLAFFRSWRLRVFFLLAAVITGVSTYFPALIQDYRIVYANVFGYRGLILQTTSGIPLWGPSVLLFSTFVPIQNWPDKYLQPTLFILERSWSIGIIAMFALMWFRRNRRSAEDFCATIGMAYVILLGFSDYWAFQYFAWSLPFWFFLPGRFSIPAVSLASAYLYSLYWFFCGNGWLHGKWDFLGHPNLPIDILILRDVAVLFFLVSGCVFLLSAMRRTSIPKLDTGLITDEGH